MSDLRIDLLEPGVAVQLYEINNDNYTLMGAIPVDDNWQNVTIHCGVITKGGHYLLQLVSNDTTEDVDIIQVKFMLNYNIYNFYQAINLPYLLYTYIIYYKLQI